MRISFHLMGDFYEAFGEEAEAVGKALNITVTTSTRRDLPVRMAGIPKYCADRWFEDLRAAGHEPVIAT